MMSMLRTLGGRVVKFGKCLWNIIWHGDINVTLVIVSIDSEAEIAGTCPVDSESIIFTKGFEKVVGV